jgi:hypothetical protein
LHCKKYKCYVNNKIGSIYNLDECVIECSGQMIGILFIRPADRSLQILY